MQRGSEKSGGRNASVVGRLRQRLRRPREPFSGKVFGIGLSRTGTTSLNAALEMLGRSSVHFPADEISREEVLRFLASDAKLLRLTLLETVDGITDTPACVAFEALDTAYPGSKFILTVRDKQTWLKSCETFWRLTHQPFVDAHPDDSEGDFLRAISDRLYGTVRFDADLFAAGYDAYHRRVSNYFRGRAHDLLTLDICGGQGWETLCPFLGASEPEAAFPWTNTAPSAPLQAR